MGTDSPRPVKPLAKPKHWALSLVEAGELLEAWDQPVPEVCRRSVPSLVQQPVEFLAKSLWDISHQFYMLALNNYQWRETSGMRAAILRAMTEDRVRLSSIVWIQDAAFGNRQALGVGQLMSIEREPPETGAPRLYELDGGPARFSERYVLKLLDGTVVPWTNATPHRVPDHHLIEMFKSVYRDERMRVRPDPSPSHEEWPQVDPWNG